MVGRSGRSQTARSAKVACDPSCQRDVVLCSGHATWGAGTKRGPDGALIAAGGRVLNVCALGASVKEARERAYGAIARIDWPDGFHRTDIGWRALAP